LSIGNSKSNHLGAQGAFNSETRACSYIAAAPAEEEAKGGERLLLAGLDEDVELADERKGEQLRGNAKRETG